MWLQLLTKLVSPAVSQGSDSVCNHMLKGGAGNMSMEGSKDVAGMAASARMEGHGPPWA